MNSYFATYILHIQGAVRYVDSQSVMTYEHRSPAGIFALITPWNMPLYLLTWKIAPCLAFGCVAVAKPSEVTSITAFSKLSCCDPASTCFTEPSHEFLEKEIQKEE